MTFALRVKRAMIDNLDGFNEPADANWGQTETNAYSYFCNKFGGSFSNYPSRADQSEDFLNFIDNYEDEEYTNREVKEVEAPKPTNSLSGFVPDRQPIPKEGDVETRKQLNSLLNENANIKPLPPKEKATEPSKTTENKDKEEETEKSKETENGQSNNTSAETAKSNVNQGAPKSTPAQAPKAKPPTGNVPGVGKIKVR